jgi:hypothetical protein
MQHENEPQPNYKILKRQSDQTDQILNSKTMKQLLDQKQLLEAMKDQKPCLRVMK